MNKIIEIKSIQFESNNSEALIKGNIRQGNLNYPTDILVSQTQLNIIVNQLSKKNEDFNFFETLVIEEMYNTKIYISTLESSIDSSFYLNELLAPKSYIQIRA